MFSNDWNGQQYEFDTGYVLLPLEKAQSVMSLAWNCHPRRASQLILNAPVAGGRR